MAKTKALISGAVTAQLICVFVSLYANRWFSHAKAHLPFLTWIKHEQPSYLIEKFWSGVNVSLYHRSSNHVSYLDKSMNNPVIG